MNTTDRIESLLKQGVVSLTIGTSPNKLLFVQARQGVRTGADGTHVEATHQSEGVSLEECLNQVSKQVEHLNKIKTSNMIHIPRSN